MDFRNFEFLKFAEGSWNKRGVRGLGVGGYEGGKEQYVCGKRGGVTIMKIKYKRTLAPEDPPIFLAQPTSTGKEYGILL